MNNISIIGRLGKDPELKTTGSGKTVATFSVAVDRRGRTDEMGNRITDWFNAVCWERTAETAAQYLRKGQRVGLSGRIEFRRFTDKNGMERDTHDLVVSELDLLGDGGGEGRNETPRPASRPAAPRPASAPAAPATKDDGYDPFGDE